MSSLDQTFNDICTAWLEPAAAVWYREQCRDPYKAFYLYYKPSQRGIAGVLVIAEDPPNDEYRLATPERIPVTMGPPSVIEWARGIARHLDILPY